MNRRRFFASSLAAAASLVGLRGVRRTPSVKAAPPKERKPYLIINEDAARTLVALEQQGGRDLEQLTNRDLKSIYVSVQYGDGTASAYVPFDEWRERWLTDELMRLMGEVFEQTRKGEHVWIKSWS